MTGRHIFLSGIGTQLLPFIIWCKLRFAEDAFSLCQVFKKTLASLTPVCVVMVTTLLIVYFGAEANSKHWTVVCNLRGVKCSNHEATAWVKLNELRWINSPIEWKGRQTNQNGGLTIWKTHPCGRKKMQSLLAECWYRASGSWVAAEWRWSIGRVLADMLVGSCWPTLDRVSVDISAECRSPYRPIVSTHTWSTDALSTHDPKIPHYFHKEA